MIKKPDAAWGRDDDRMVETARAFGGAASQALSDAPSGIARVRATKNAVVSISIAAVSGWKALTAGVAHGNIGVAVILGGFSLAACALALTNFRKAAGATPSARATQQWLPESAGLGGVSGAGAAAGWTARDTDSPALGDSTVICYDRAKIFWKAATLSLPCLLLATILTRVIQFTPAMPPAYGTHFAGPTHNSPIFAFFALIALGYYLWRVFGLLLRGTDKDLTAISWNDRQIKLRTMMWSRQVPWSAFESVLVKRKTFRLYGIIPLATSHSLMFRVCHNGSSRLLEVPCGLLAIRLGEIGEVLRRIELRHAQYVCGRLGGADQRNAGAWQPAEASPRGARVSDTVADTLARAPGFGTQAPISAAPAAFGRKVS